MVELAKNRNNKKIVKLKYGELFCGPGGMGLGAKKAKVFHNNITYKIEHKWASDYDKDSCLSYQHNVSPHVLHQNVRSLNFKSLSKVDIFSYGFPCNDFSIVGEQRGMKGKFGPLYKYGVYVLNIQNPKVFIAENVGGLISANKGKSFMRILEDLQEAGKGYNLTVHKYKFEEYGIPQTRHRIIIVGVRKDLPLTFHIPKPTHIGNYVTAMESLECPPIKPNTANHSFMKVSDKIVQRLKYIKPWRNVWNSDMPKNLKINCASSQLSHIYRRLSANKPSYTITGSGGGGTYGYHWKENRPLTNRERARLQTFPDNFVFMGNRNSVRKQIGMAVPPQMAQILFECVIKTIFNIPYPYVDSDKNLYQLNSNKAQIEMSL